MPCDRIYEISEKFEAKNRLLLDAMVKRLGWKYISTSVIQTNTGERIVLADGQARCQNLQAIRTLKFEYANQAKIYATTLAAQKGYQVQKLSETKIQVRLS